MRRARPPATGAAGFRRRLMLERPAHATDPLGGVLPLWQPVGPVWLRIERREAPKLRPEPAASTGMLLRVTLRWRPGLAPGQRFTGTGLALLIRAVLDPDGRQRTLVCLCQEDSP